MDIEVFDPASQIYHLKMAGFSFPQIAKKLNISSDYATEQFIRYRKHQAALISPDERRVALEEEVERLNQLQSAYYDSALAGDLRAAEYVLKVIIERAKLRGLDKIDGTDKVQIANVLVVGGSQKEFIDALNAGRAVRRLTGPEGNDGDDQQEASA